MSQPGQEPNAPDERAATGQSTGDQPEPTLLEQMGGVSGLFYSSVPVLVFVLVNALTSLMPAIWASIGSAVLIAVVRLIRKEPLQPAISGLFGIAIAAFIAYRTGSAKGFFLFGVWASLIYGGVFLASILVRWPLAGVVWSTLNGSGMAWRKDKPALRGYDLATLTWTLVFFGRFVVQRWLYEEDQVGWLAFARIAMGYPLTALALVVTVWAVRRADRRMQAAEQARERENQEAEERLRAAARFSTRHRLEGGQG